MIDRYSDSFPGLSYDMTPSFIKLPNHCDALVIKTKPCSSVGLNEIVKKNVMPF